MLLEHDSAVSASLPLLDVQDEPAVRLMVVTGHLQLDHLVRDLPPTQIQTTDDVLQHQVVVLVHGQQVSVSVGYLLHLPQSIQVTLPLQQVHLSDSVLIP